MRPDVSVLGSPAVKFQGLDPQDMTFQICTLSNIDFSDLYFVQEEVQACRQQEDGKSPQH